ncbi:rCG23289, isoform CRA_a, partial [Rattus norvegicus]
MVNSQIGSSVLLTIIKLKTKRDKAFNMGEYFVFSKEENIF